MHYQDRNKTSVLLELQANNQRGNSQNCVYNRRLAVLWIKSSMVNGVLQPKVTVCVTDHSIDCLRYFVIKLVCGFLCSQNIPYTSCDTYRQTEELSGRIIVPYLQNMRAIGTHLEQEANSSKGVIVISVAVRACC